MVRTNIYYLTGLMLDFWRESDNLKKIRTQTDQDIADYREASLRTVKAAKRVNHEALTRLLESEYPIPYPWEGDGGLEQ